MDSLERLFARIDDLEATVARLSSELADLGAARGVVTRASDDDLGQRLKSVLRTGAVVGPEQLTRQVPSRRNGFAASSS